MKMVKVVWVDAAGMDGWSSQLSLNSWIKNRTSGGVVMVSVGWLYEKTKKCVVIAQSRHKYDKQGNMGETLMIPMSCVLKIKRLK